MRYKENAELSTKMIYGLLLIATIIALVVVLFWFVMAADIHPDLLPLVTHCNIMYYDVPAYCIPFIFYFIGESVVFVTFIWIKHISVKHIEEFKVNCPQSKLEMRFQLKKNVEVTNSVLPLMMVNCLSGILGLIITIYAYWKKFGPFGTIFTIEMLCCIAAPIYFFASPIVLMWSEPKLRPRLRVGDVNFNDDASRNSEEGRKKEGDMRLQALAGAWNCEFQRRASVAPKTKRFSVFVQASTHID